jgi:hypothetical protein
MYSFDALNLLKKSFLIPHLLFRSFDALQVQHAACEV